jgi:hypothetical protein
LPDIDKLAIIRYDNYDELAKGVEIMNKQTYYDCGYEINHVNYSGRYGGDDLICQIKRISGAEIAHCTWHPGSRTPNRHGSCPYQGRSHCLEKGV